MALSIGIRPRSAQERLQLARALASAPRVVALDYPDDGWAAAHLRVAGRVPVWGGRGDPSAAEALLARLGLPGLGRERPGGRLDGKLRLTRSAPVASEPLPRVRGPLVTVLICTYNRARLLPQALASALAQSWPCEVLVVDDGSTDDTPAVLAGVEGVRVIRQENTGKPGALNRGLAEASGEAVLVLDDDDLLLPGAVQVLAHALFGRPELAAVFSDTVYLDERGVPARHYPATRLPGAMATRACLQQVPGTTGSTLVRMSAQRAAGEYDPRLTRGEDMDMFLRLSRVGPVETLPLTTFLVRRHDGARGAAHQRIHEREKAAYEAKFLEIARPVFAERWAAMRGGADRAEGHAWVVGLAQRGLLDEARSEAARWPGPHTPCEAWSRGQAGLKTPTASPTERLVVVDDGDPGALEETLHRWGSLRELFIDLEVHRDPLGSVQLYWPGAYAAQERLHRWLPPGPFHIALSSSPGWAPQRLPDPRLLPDLPAPLAVRFLAAAMGWPLPDEERPGLQIDSPGLNNLYRARAAVERGLLHEALSQLLPVLKALPGWAPLWWLTAEVFDAAGETAKAAAYRAKGQSLAA